mgnify:FL=1
MICPRCNNLLIHGLCDTCTVQKFATKRYSNHDVLNHKRLRPSVIHDHIQQLEDVEILPQKEPFQVFRPWNTSQGKKNNNSNNS